MNVRGFIESRYAEQVSFFERLQLFVRFESGDASRSFSDRFIASICKNHLQEASMYGTLKELGLSVFKKLVFNGCYRVLLEHYGFSLEDLETIVDITFRKNIFIKRYFGSISLALETGLMS